MGSGIFRKDKDAVDTGSDKDKQIHVVLKCILFDDWPGKEADQFDCREQGLGSMEYLMKSALNEPRSMFLVEINAAKGEGRTFPSEPELMSPFKMGPQQPELMGPQQPETR